MSSPMRCSSMVSCSISVGFGVGAEDQLGARRVDDRAQLGVLALLDDHVGRAGVLRDDQARLLPVLGRGRREDAGDRGPRTEEHGERQPADDGAAGPRRLDLAAARSARHERRDQPAPAERVRLDQVLLGCHVARLAPDRRVHADRDQRHRQQREQGDALGDVTEPSAAHRRAAAGAASRPAGPRPVAASTTAIVGRHSGCTQSAATAAESRPTMPETRPTSTSGPVRYCRVRSITTRQHRTARIGAGQAERDRERRDQHEQQADRRGDGDQDLVGDARVGADPAGVDRTRLGGDVGDVVELVDRRAGRPEREPGEDAADDHDQDQRDRQDDGGVEVGRLHQQTR